MDRFGDNVYNLYGSTEVAYATVATPAGPARRPRHRRPAAARHRGQALRRGRQGGPAGEVGRIFVGNEMSFEGYTGGGGKEAIDGLLQQRRRRPLRRRRPALHRRPRRRDDRLRRRERLPARGRGPARRPRGRRRGGRDRRRGRRVRPAAEGLRRRSPTGAEAPRTTSRPTSRRTSPATRRRARSSSSTSCRATPPARSSSASCTRARPRSPPDRSADSANCGYLPGPGVA